MYINSSVSPPCLPCHAQAPLSPPQLPPTDPVLQQRLADLESTLWQEQQQLRLEQMRLQHLASQFHARNTDLLGQGSGTGPVASMFTLPPPLSNGGQPTSARHGQVLPGVFPSDAVLHASRAWMASPGGDRSRASSECSCLNSST